MIELGAASEDEVVLAFLRAEIDSPKWGPLYLRLLRDLHLDRGSLIDVADVADVRAGSIRKDILGAARGYGRDVALFTGFPPNTTWRRVQVEPSDFRRLKCISRDDRWSELTTARASFEMPPLTSTPTRSLLSVYAPRLRGSSKVSRSPS